MKNLHGVVARDRRRRYVVPRIAAAVAIALTACILSPAPLAADSLLYARFNNQLFTVDTQTGAMTFVSDGPLQWLASPAFDEHHHTRLWIVDENELPVKSTFDPIGFFWGNPFTGEVGGPYPTTLTYNTGGDPYIGAWLVTEPAVYAPTTQRLYIVGSIMYTNTIITAIMVDQFAGPPAPGWGYSSPDIEWSNVGATAMAFDPVSELIIVAVSAGNGFEDHQSYLVAFSPVTGTWYGDSSPRPSNAPFVLPHQDIPPEYDGAPPLYILAMAIDPASGDLYFVKEEGYAPQTTTLAHLERSTGTVTPIADMPLGSWSMTFADARYAQ